MTEVKSAEVIAYLDLIRELCEFKEALGRHGGATIEEFHIGSPASDATIEDLEPQRDEVDDEVDDEEEDRDDELRCFPDVLANLAKVADGVRLFWRLELAAGRTVSGRIELPTLEDLQWRKSRSFYEGELSWDLLPQSEHAEILLPCDEEGLIVVLSEVESFCMTDTATMPSIWRTMMDRLGIEGWGLTLDEYNATSCNPYFEEILERCEADARTVRLALGLPIPSKLAAASEPPKA